MRRVRARLIPAGARSTALERLGLAVAALPVARPFAGSRSPSALGAAVVGAVAGAATVALSVEASRRVPAALAGGAAGWLIGESASARGRRRALLETTRALPFALDRIATCLRAGMSVERALRLVAPKTPHALGEAFAAGLRALDAGIPRALAYQRIADAAGHDDVRAVLRTVARAERFGTSVVDALAAHARELRHRASAEAEAEARTAPVKLVFPLTLCFLPAFVLLTIGPIAVTAVRSLGAV